MIRFFCLAICLAGCAQTKITTYDSVSGKKRMETSLGGNYGLVPTHQSRGNAGGGGGGFLSGLFPSFDYQDNHIREFAEAEQPTRIEITEDGMIIEGVVDHSTTTDIAADATNRAIRNIATMVGWLKLFGTVEAINEAGEITARLLSDNATAIATGETMSATSIREAEIALEGLIATQ